MIVISMNWCLLALCGVLDAIIAVIYVNHAGSGFASYGSVEFLCGLAVAAGACTIAVGIWGSREGRSWLLALNGLALSAYGLIPILWTGPLSFRLFALLLVVMATSIGIFELTKARSLRLLGLAGAASIGFALVFLAFVLRWIQLTPGPAQTLLWMGAYFGFSAICMVVLPIGIERRAGN
jgi:hypothetical protein